MMYTYGQGSEMPLNGSASALPTFRNLFKYCVLVNTHKINDNLCREFTLKWKECKLVLTMYNEMDAITL